MDEETKKLDAPFEWYRLEEYGLPWEASAYLLEMWALVKEERVIKGVGGYAMPTPTSRQVRWWWRIHLAAPDIQMFDVWFLAQRFVSRELAHEVLGVPLALADLAAYLAYKPWTDDENLQVYHVAIEKQRIPPLKRLSELFSDMTAVGNITRNPTNIAFTLITEGMLPGPPELLPSQRILRQYQKEDEQ